MYCQMLQESILQYFRPSLSYHLSFRSFFFEYRLKTGFTVLQHTDSGQMEKVNSSDQAESSLGTCHFAGYIKHWLKCNFSVFQQIGSVVTTLRQFKALESFPQNPLCGDILWPTNNETYFDKNMECNLKIEVCLFVYLNLSPFKIHKIIKKT